MKELIPLFYIVGGLGLVGSGCAALPADDAWTRPEVDFDEVESTESLGDTWTRPADERVMVYVPEGEFEMGSTDARVDEALALCRQFLRGCSRAWFEAEQPAHTIGLHGFWIDRTEVTNVQYQRCVEAEACETPKVWNIEFRDPAKANHPKVHVDWFEAESYCEWAEARLLTEAEWEYAARGPDGLDYPWGDEFDGTRVNYCDANCPETHADETVDDGWQYTAPVGSYPDGESWCGALDIAGNVAEWVEDWYAEDYYEGSPSRNPRGPSSGDYRAVRRGGWGSDPHHVRGAGRIWAPPGETAPFIGFRCAQYAD